MEKSRSTSRPSPRKQGREVNLSPVQWQALVEAELRTAVQKIDAGRMRELEIGSLSVHINLADTRAVEVEVKNFNQPV